jgi:hypothetical protein
VVERYDPAVDRWIRLPDMLVAHPEPVATTLADGRVLVLDRAGAEVFDPSTGVWTSTGPKTSQATTTVTPLTDGRVLVVGGAYGMSSPSPDLQVRQLASLAEVWSPSTNTWTRLPAPSGNGGDGHSATRLPDGRVLLAGGLTRCQDRGPGFSCVTTDTTRLFDPRTDEWRPGPTMADGRMQHGATLLSSGKVLLAGGQERTSWDICFDDCYPRTAELFDPSTGSLSPAAALHTERVDASLVALDAGRALVAGGAPTEGECYSSDCSPRRSAEVFQP